MDEGWRETRSMSHVLLFNANCTETCDCILTNFDDVGNALSNHDSANWKAVGERFSYG